MQPFPRRRLKENIVLDVQRVHPIERSKRKLKQRTSDQRGSVLNSTKKSPSKAKKMAKIHGNQQNVDG
jgi:hypothetical protein